MTASANSQVSFNMSMMENPLMKNFIIDSSNYSENLDSMVETTPELQVQINPGITAEIEPFLEDFDSSVSIGNSPVVSQQPALKIKTLTKRVLESTLEVITETSTSDEKFVNAAQTESLYEDFNHQFQAIVKQAGRKIQQATRTSHLNLNSVIEEMQQLKMYAAEKKTAVFQFLDLIKKASAMKKKLIELDQKERRS